MICHTHIFRQLIQNFQTEYIDLNFFFNLYIMTDLTNILGIALIGVGAASAVYGTILCYSVKVIC